jgi:hypothetical protein
MRDGNRTRKAVPARPSWFKLVNPRFSAGEGVAWTGGKVGAGRGARYGTGVYARRK